MVESFRAGSPLSREGIADALLTTLISIAIKYIPLSPPEYQIQFCYIFDKFTNLSGPVAEQPMPACFQILEILDRLGILKKNHAMLCKLPLALGRHGTFSIFSKNISGDIGQSCKPWSNRTLCKILRRRSLSIVCCDNIGNPF